MQKPFRYCSALLLQTQLGRHKCSSGRHKLSSARSVSEAAPRFENLCVYNPSTLRKKPSTSSEETFRFSEEAFRFVEEAFQFAIQLRCKCISEKHSECERHFYLTRTVNVVLKQLVHVHDCSEERFTVYCLIIQQVFNNCS